MDAEVNPADRPGDSIPAEVDGDTPHVEIEFEVLSVYRPRVIRVTMGDGGEVAQEYPIDDEPLDDGETAPSRADGDPGRGTDAASVDDSMTTIVLWAYYEACRKGALPWERPHNSRAWRAFRQAMLSDPDRRAWWSDPAQLLRRAKAAYRQTRH